MPLPRKTWLPLSLLLAAIVLLEWIGVLGVGYSSDDYQFIHHLAPIRSLADVARAFVDFDPNPQYWRPLANASAAFDFLVWGWNGGMFHLSNLLLHCVSTLLVFFLARDVFRFETSLALITSFLFGIAASHESNLLWPAARADELTAVFAMTTLLAYRRVADANSRHRAWWYLLAAISFWLAMLSKELGVMTIGLVILFFEFKPLIRRADRRGAMLRVIGFVALLALFIIVRSHYTIAPTETEPLLSEGARSPIAFLRNAAYGIGYMLIPLDLERATDILNGHAALMLSAAAVIAALTIVFIARLQPEQRRRYVMPLLFMLVTGIVAMQSFERWRWYAPSAGLFAIVALLGADIWSRWRGARIPLLALAGVLLSFHLYRAEAAVTDWRLAADQLESVKPSLIEVLQRRAPNQTIDLITAPAKLGSAMVMQNASFEFVRECEAERRQAPEHRFGSAKGCDVPTYKAIDLYEFDHNAPYPGLIYSRNGDSIGVAVSDSSRSLWLVPALFLINGVSRRHWHFEPGDTAGYEPNILTIQRPWGSMAKQIQVRVNPDSNVLPVVFDGRRFSVLR